MDNESAFLKKMNDSFISSMMMLLDSVREVKDNQQIKRNCEMLMIAILKNELGSKNIGSIIKRAFSLISQNATMLVNMDPKIFEIKDKSILPGIDILSAYSSATSESKKNIWKYTKSLYLSSCKMIQVAKKSSITSQIQEMMDNLEKEINLNMIISEFVTKFPNNGIIDEFDPIIGVRVEGGFSLNDVVSNSKLAETETESNSGGISAIAKMIGMDKMFNMGELLESLKNINPQDIEDAALNINNLLGGSLDEETSGTISNILTEVASKLKTCDLSKGNPLDNIVQIAQTVAVDAIPKIDPSKLNKESMLKATDNFTRNMRDPTGKKVFGDINPLSMLTNMMETTMMGAANKNMSQDQMQDEYLKQCNNMFSGMGLNIDTNKMKQMSEMLKKSVNDGKMKK